MLNRLFILLSLMFTALGCGAEKQNESAVVVFAAASLSDSMSEVAARFESETGLPVHLSFAGSGALAEQVLAGAKADLFISANEVWISKLIEQLPAMTPTEQPLLTNGLVIVANSASSWSIDSIDQLSTLPCRYFVIGNPRFVPAGRYAKEYLQAMDVGGQSTWDSIADRISPTADLRRVLALVESDRSLVGIVYATDAAKSNRVRVIFEVPETKVRVNYYCAEIKASPSEVGSHQSMSAFSKFLRGDEATAIFQKFGFATGR